MAVRRPDGDIYTEVQMMHTKWAWARSTVLRGPLALVESVAVGLRGLRISLNQSVGESPTPPQMAITFGIVLFTFVAVFVAAPGVVAGGLGGAAAPVAEAGTRFAMLAGYFLLISRASSTRRLFAYHGAEHKVIAAFEAAGAVPEEEAARRASPVHVRCGTDFIAIFVMTAGVVYSFAPRLPWWSAVGWRVGGLPVLVALAYELMRAAARHPDEWWSRMVTWPGRTLQRITTREPDDAQLEVAMAALKAVIA